MYILNFKKYSKSSYLKRQGLRHTLIHPFCVQFYTFLECNLNVDSDTLHLFGSKPQKLWTQSNITVAVLLPHLSNVLTSDYLPHLFRAVKDNLTDQFFLFTGTKIILGQKKAYSVIATRQLKRKQLAMVFIVL